jgi:cytochrome c/ABC-type molybdate transport system substrate-binding protein
LNWRASITPNKATLNSSDFWRFIMFCLVQRRPRRNLAAITLAMAAIGAMVTVGFAAMIRGSAEKPWNGQVKPPRYQEQIFPPWSNGRNDPAVHKGLEFTVPEVDDLPDFHGDPFTSRLSIFVGGNYYFAMAPLVDAFEKRHPSLRGHIYYETLPPGILIKQMKAGGTITIGNMTWTVKPDVFAAGKLKVAMLIHKQMLKAPLVTYATNDLAIMVPAANPAHIKSLRDLGRAGVRLSMPNPKWEGVARQIKLSLQKAGGKSLVAMVYHTKVRTGQTILTHIHHRQTPLYLMQGLADAGVTWKSEAIFQEQVGHPISFVPIAKAYNTRAIYAGAVVRGAAHPNAAREWLAFLKSKAAQKIFHHYGFKSVANQDPPADPTSLAVPKHAGPTASSAAGPSAPWGVVTYAHGRVVAFTPPPASGIPNNKFGRMVRLGRQIFDNTPKYAGKYIGDGLSCENCHLASGTAAYSAPMWGAYPAYPRYQGKVHAVVTMSRRIQECFEFSENSHHLPRTSGKIITALDAYSAWLSRAAPVGAQLPGRGYISLKAPPLKPSVSRGKQDFIVNCEMCHGAHGQGMMVGNHYQFPPLWGPHSYNAGAGMHKVKLAAEFIQHNMPLGRAGTLTLQQAWDLAAYIDSHERPPNPMQH